MAIDVNTGPERVEVTAVPIGTVLPQGSSTARTALIIATSKAGAPLNTPIAVFNLSSFESTFGNESDMGEAYLSAKGFYDNGGEGSELIIVAVSPSGVSGSILEVSQNQDARSVVGSFGSILDDGIMMSGALSSAYDVNTGLLTLNVGGATGSLSKVRVGDLVQDADGRLFPISKINGTDKVYIEANLDQESSKSSKSLSVIGSSIVIVRLFSDNAYDAKTVIQEGTTYGSGVSVTAAGRILTTVSFDSYLNDVKSGDILVDSASEEFIITSIIDGNNLEVDREGLVNGVVDFKSGLKNKVILTSTDAGSSHLSIGSEPYEAEAGILRFNLLDSADNSPVGVLSGYFLKFSDGSKEKIKSNSIVAESTQLLAPLVASISYDALTGIVTLPVGTLAVTAGAKSGDVLIDVNGKEFVIHEMISEESIRISKGLASPSSVAGSKIHKGAMEIELEESTLYIDKITGGSDVDASGEIHSPAISMIFEVSANMKSDDYFIATPAVQEIDYKGSSSDFSGLHALDSVDIVNLIAIPGIYSPSVQGALIDYCSIDRSDSMALVSIPEFINSASIDALIVSNLSISSVTNSSNGSIIKFIGSPDLSEVSTYDLLKIGAKQFIVKAASDEDDEIVVFETTGIPTVGSVSVQRPSAISWKDVIINKPTTKVAWYYNHLIVDDSFGGSAIVDPVGHVAGIMNRIDANIPEGGVSHAPAGINLAQLAGTTGLQLQVSERLDGGPLRLAFINRITSSVGNGRYVFGGYTGAGAQKTPDEQLIQVIRSILYVKSSLEAGLVGFLWENNSPVNRQNITNTILAFMRTNGHLYPAGLPEEQQFLVSAVTPDDLALAQGLVEVTIQVRFNTAIKFISIDLQFPLPVAGN